MTLALFKGELSYDDIVNKLVFRRLLELRSARVNRLMEEAQEVEKQQKERESESIRNQIVRASH